MIRGHASDLDPSIVFLVALLCGLVPWLLLIGLAALW